MQQWCKYVIGLVAIGLTLGVVACAPESEGDIFDRPFQGNANLRRLIVVGDNFTAGYMNGALYQNGQDHSVGNLLAQRAAEAVEQPFPFIQPDVQSEIGFGGVSETGQLLGRMVLRNVQGFGTPLPARLAGEQLAPYTGDAVTLGNFSVPDAKILDVLVPGYGLENPFYGRFASSIGSSTLIADVVRAQPTFFVFWMGFRDVLNYAMSGATGRDGGPNRNDLTSIEDFRIAYRASVNSLLATEASGLLVNLPDILHLPFFNALPHNLIYTTREDSLALWEYYFAHNIAVAGWNADVGVTPGLSEEERAALRRPFIVFRGNSFNGVVIEDPSLPDATAFMPNGTIVTIPKIRQLRPGEMLLLSFPYEQLADGLGTRIPTPKRHALSLAEIERIRNRIGDFNRIIRDQADQAPGRLGFVDMRANLREFFGGFPADFNGVPFSPDFQPIRGAYSADGTYLNARGNAHIANKIIEAMNAQFQSNLFFIDINEYEGNPPAL